QTKLPTSARLGTGLLKASSGSSRLAAPGLATQRPACGDVEATSSSYKLLDARNRPQDTVSAAESKLRLLLCTVNATSASLLRRMQAKGLSYRNVHVGTAAPGCPSSEARLFTSPQTFWGSLTSEVRWLLSEFTRS